MDNAILIGNGVTSQIIEDYKDETMMDKLKGQVFDLYSEIDGYLDLLRALPVKDQSSIVEALRTQGIPMPEKHYSQYFVDYKLLEELTYPHIASMETLLKVAQLYHHVSKNGKTPISRIKAIANAIYYNEGSNGLNVSNSKINPTRFTDYICGFDYVFTTNFDHLLDDAYS